MFVGRFLRALGRHWWALMGSAVFTIVALYAMLEGKANKWTLGVSVAVAVLFFLVAAFLTWNEEYKKHREEVGLVRKDLEAERGRVTMLEDQLAAEAPQIVLECIWPPIEHTGPGFPLLRRAVIVKNISDTMAFNVRFDVLRVDGYLAEFGKVPKVEKDHPVGVNAEIFEEDSGEEEFNGDFERLLQHVYWGRLTAQLELLIPIRFRVEFEDVHGNLYESIHELMYDTWNLTGEFHFKSFARLSPTRCS